MGLDLDSISYHIESHAVLDDVTFSVPTGSTVAVVGPSGVGKSTLLRVIAGIVTPTSGRVAIDGLDITRSATHTRRIGMVFQDDQLFPHLSVAENIGFGLDVAEGFVDRWFSTPASRKLRRQQRAERIAEVLHLVGLDGFENRHVQGLSGGEAKRVALARALAPIPAVLLLDEPLTGLDRDLHDRLMGDLRRILAAAGTTTILVTHDMAEARYLAERIVHLHHPGAASKIQPSDR